MNRGAASGLFLFGWPAFEAAGVRVALPAARPHQLLSYLACRGTWVTREAAAAMFWPDRDSSTARANLRFVLVQVRHLEHVEGLETPGHALCWEVDSDVRRFERAMEAKRWADALAEYGGPLLEGFEVGAPAPFVDWLQFERARLHSLWHDASAERLGQLTDDPAAGVALATRALHVDPLDEAALAFQLRALVSLGRAVDARTAYRAYAQRLAAELGIEPSLALRDLARDIDARRAKGTAPFAVGRRTAPISAPTLIGRRLELTRVRQLLREDDCRLLTVTGPGGAGKTMLARAAMVELAADAAAGAYWVALDDLTATDQVAGRCAAAIGVELSGSQSPDEQLCHHLRSARALLAFDNAEHLSGFGAWLEGVLSKCDGLKALATSRARLQVPGEHLLPLEGLPVPDPEETEPEVLRAFDAVRLFERCAARVLPDFDARANAVEVAALVRAMGGLPLAIELAAAWVRLLPVAEIRGEIGRSLDLLDDAAEQRSHSVRASFEYSWRLLARAEQRALLQLSVFHGDFSRESARAVAGVALPLLAALADKSMLRAEPSGRFAFHPLLRQFAQEKLLQAGVDETSAAQVRHAEHFLALLARHNDFESGNQLAALKEIGAEFTNVIVAWQWAIGERRADLLQRCAGAMEGYLDARGQQQIGLHQFNLALSAIDEAAPAHQVARCHIELGRAAFCFRRGEFTAGEASARAALQAAMRARYRFGIKSATNTLGLILWRLGRMAEAAYCLRSALRRARSEANPSETALYAGNLAAVEREVGHYAEAESLLTQAIEHFRRAGNVSGLMGALNELALLHNDCGRPDAAIELAREGLALAEKSQFNRGVPYGHQRLAEAYFALGALDSSAEHARRVLDTIQAGGDRTLEPVCRLRLGLIELRRGNGPAALAELQNAARLALEMKTPRMQFAIALGYARYCLLLRRIDEARALFSLVADHPSALYAQRRSAVAEIAALPAPSGLISAAADSLDPRPALEHLLSEPP